MSAYVYSRGKFPTLNIPVMFMFRLYISTSYLLHCLSKRHMFVVTSTKDCHVYADLQMGHVRGKTNYPNLLITFTFIHLADAFIQSDFKES